MGIAILTGAFTLLATIITSCLAQQAAKAEREHDARIARDARNHEARMARWVAFREAIASFVRASHVDALRYEIYVVESVEPADDDDEDSGLMRALSTDGLVDRANQAHTDHRLARAELAYWRTLLPPALQDAAGRVSERATKHAQAVEIAERASHHGSPEDYEKAEAAATRARASFGVALSRFRVKATEWLAAGVDDVMPPDRAQPVAVADGSTKAPQKRGE